MHTTLYDMQVTLQLEPLFKRNVAFVTESNANLPEAVAMWGKQQSLLQNMFIVSVGKISLLSAL
jgi:hypothetical protein